MDVDELISKVFDLCNIGKYHEMGYTGKGITILNHEAKTGHAKMTTDILKLIAPDAKIINAEVSFAVISGKISYYKFTIDGKNYTINDVMNEFKPDIMSVSFIGKNKYIEDIISKYVDDGSLTICCATGNKGSKGDLGMYGDIAISVGSINMNNQGKIDLNSYSGRGEVGEVTTVGFNMTGEGTSAATPFIAGMVALFMNKYGKMSQADVIKHLIVNNSMDLGKEGLDEEFGYGVPILPLDYKLEEDKDMSKFTDVKDDDWFVDAVEWGEENGIIKGFEDGSFKPNEPITRAEAIVMLKRMYALLHK